MMQNDTTISIVIPHFKRHEHLRNALESLARQDYPDANTQVIVVEDNAAREDKHALSDDFPFVEFVKCYAHVGAACAKNIGAKRARGKWLVFIDDDIELDRRWLAMMMAEALATPAVSCFQAKVVSSARPDMIKSTGGVANEFGYAWDRGVFEKDLGQYDLKKEILFASSCAMLIRKDLFDRIGGFDNDLFYMGEDHDLGLRLRMLGEKVHFVPAALCKHADKEGGADEVLRQKYYIERNRLFILLKNYETRYVIALLLPLIILKLYKYIAYCFRFKRKKLGYARDVLSGWIWILTHVRLLIKKRKEINALRTVGVRSIMHDFVEYRQYLASVMPNER